MHSWKRMVWQTAVLAALGASAAAAESSPDESAFRALYQELVEINTTRSVGSCTRAAEAVRARLLSGRRTVR